MEAKPENQTLLFLAKNWPKKCPKKHLIWNFHYVLHNIMAICVDKLEIALCMVEYENCFSRNPNSRHQTQKLPKSVENWNFCVFL